MINILLPVIKMNNERARQKCFGSASTGEVHASSFLVATARALWPWRDSARVFTVSRVLQE